MPSTALGLFNYLICQWFFFRLAMLVEIIDGEAKSSRWALLWFVVPLTGWGSPYKHVGRKRLTFIWKLEP